MKKSTVAIVGRPNVGKSTLFNRIVKSRSAIVDFQEGVTRDKKYEEAQWSGKTFMLVDTGGIILQTSDKIDKAIRFQAEAAIEEADLILFVVDTQTGLTDLDSQIGRILSPHRKKVILVANKTDNEKDELEIYEFMQLGFGEPFPVAAVHGRNMGNFLDEVTQYVEDVPEEEKNEDEIKIALIGKPNAGKSSLINRIFGEEISIVTDIAGTTRDSIDSKMRHFGKDLIFIDTAGLRRKARIKYGVEYFSSMRAIESIDRCDVVLLVIDATQKVSSQDQKIASYATRNFKDIIVLINKWDLIEKDNKTTKKFSEELSRELPFLEYAPKMFISALSGQRVHKVLDMIMSVHEESKKRITTSQLNKFLDRAVQKFPPSHSSGKHAKIYFCTQVKTHPPTFVFFCNNPKLITVHYRRYLTNQLREAYKFEGATIRTFYRGRDESALDD